MNPILKGVFPIIRFKNGCDFHRIILPLEQMNYDFSEYQSTPGIPGKRGFNDVEVLFFNRFPLSNLDEISAMKKKYGFKIVVDVDDWWELNSTHIMYAQYLKDDTFNKQIKALQLADAVTCTTARLAEKVKPFNKNITIIPNALPYDIGQFDTTVVQAEGAMRFMYVGGVTHFWDIKVMENPFKKITHERIPAKFIMCGFSSDKFGNTDVWQKIESAFTIGYKLHNYERRESLPLTEYMHHYAYTDVSLVPLESNIFTPYKSNLKILEAGAKNLPVIVSNVPPYNDDIPAEYCMFSSNTKDWYNNIKYCVKNPSFVKESGLKLGQYVRENYNLAKMNETRLQLFDYLKKS